MRIPVPHNRDYPLVSIMLFTPKGELGVTVDDSHFSVDIALPAGVHEDEVDVYACFLTAAGRPPFGCGPSLLQAATRKPEPVPAPAVETAPAVEPTPVVPVQEPEPLAAVEPALTKEPDPAVEPDLGVAVAPEPVAAEDAPAEPVETSKVPDE